MKRKTKMYLAIIAGATIIILLKYPSFFSNILQIISMNQTPGAFNAGGGGILP